MSKEQSCEQIIVLIVSEFDTDQQSENGSLQRFPKMVDTTSEILFKGSGSILNLLIARSSKEHYRDYVFEFHIGLSFGISPENAYKILIDQVCDL